MAQYYKRYELSKSLNGGVIFCIARDAGGTVRFREKSEDKLKKAIDNYLNQEHKAKEFAAKEKVKATKTKKKRGLFEKKTGSTEGEEEAKITKEAPLRGPDGKFLSKEEIALQKQIKEGKEEILLPKAEEAKEEPLDSAQGQGEPKKKSFWDRLR